ncbi:ABC-type multidrug transport system, permease component [Fontimonas thermophila]|uniref:Transport permease protein n=1 Tax=Fontimonas thermophila TaxID=1076937 RepID=A0A1I2JP75_9GAMM|nr:ABC transporter permease [Fontimonas thermophila]SFF54937.1 ABC-type multidrug transport system, permease component [Fontimonas thermophila]
MISLRRLAAMVQARTLEFVRDVSALGWNLLLPVFMVAGMGFIFSGPGRPLFTVGVVGAGSLSAADHAFLGTPQVRFYAEDDVASGLPKVQRHRIDMLLDVSAQPVRYWINAQSSKGRLLEKLLKADDPTAQAQTVSGPQIRYVDWLAPGILGMNMMFSSLFGVGYVIVRYRKSGYLKRLNATPLRAAEFIIAQLLSRLVLIVGITVAVFVVCDLFLDFRMEGSYGDLLLVTVLGAMSMIAMGLIVSARFTSEELAGGLLNVLSWPMMIISGVFFSIEGAPEVVVWLAQLFPLTHILEAARAIMLDGAGLTDLARPLLVLGGMTIGFLLLGSILFRWTPE